MGTENSQKIKLLKLMELLHQETDENHPLTTHEILERLNSIGISCDRRTLGRDMALLNKEGFEVMECKVSREKGYYVEDRNFSLPEIKILIDAVQAASFITEKKTEELIDKLTNLGGSHRGDLMKGNLVCFNTRKHSNEYVYYNVDALETALLQKKKVIFRYFDLNDKGHRVYRREGHHYVVEPVALVFHEDNYYLMGYSAAHAGTANYRIDRMEAVEVLKDQVSSAALTLRESLEGYTGQVFKMYGGPLQEVTLDFSPDLIGVVYDKFGEKTPITPLSKDRYRIQVKVQISPVFWGWLFQFGGKMRIAAPRELMDLYEERVQALL